MIRYFPGFPGFSMIENGEDWEGPIRARRVLLDMGPI